MDRATVRVPASTSNLGPGFDTLGAALSLYCAAEIERRSGGLQVSAAGRDMERFESPVREMLGETVAAYCERAGLPRPGLAIRLHNSIPIARGLGSSSAFRLAVIAGLNMLHDAKLSDEEMLQLAAELEGHPDNCVSSFHGGLAVAGTIGGRIMYRNYPLSERLRFIAAVPDIEVATSAARSILPEFVPVRDAVFNLQRVTLLVEALREEQYDALAELLDDRLHQTHRQKLVTPLFDVIGAAREAGALGGFLSGSGSTVIALAVSSTVEIGQAMQAVFADHGIPCEILELTVDNHGLNATATL